MLRTLVLAVFCAAVVSGCSLLVGEPESPAGGGLSSVYVSGILVITTDYAEAGGVCVIDPKTLTSEVLNETIHSDSIASASEEFLFVIQRLGADSIEVRSRFERLALVANYSVGAGSNPQGFLPIADGKAIVIKYGSAWLDVIDQITGERILRIDGSRFLRGDPDGIPEFATPAVVESIAYIPVQHLNRYNAFLPFTNGELAVFDLNRLQFVDINSAKAGVQGVELRFDNPYSVRYFEGANVIAVMSVGEFGKIDGGIELVEPFSNQYLGVVLTEQAAGGELVAAVMTSRSSGFAIVSDQEFNTQLVRFDSNSIEPIAQGEGFVFVDLLLDEDHDFLFLADRSLSAPGIRVFDATTGSELTETPIDCQLPPFFLLKLP